MYQANQAPLVIDTSAEPGRRRGVSLVYWGFGLLFALALVVRIALYSVITSDYTMFVGQWYDFIRDNGGFSALQYDFSNYNPPYLYCLRSQPMCRSLN